MESRVVFKSCGKKGNASDSLVDLERKVTHTAQKITVWEEKATQK
jgi:hypothetical protein